MPTIRGRKKAEGAWEGSGLAFWVCGLFGVFAEENDGRQQFWRGISVVYAERNDLMLQERQFMHETLQITANDRIQTTAAQSALRLALFLFLASQSLLPHQPLTLPLASCSLRNIYNFKTQPILFFHQSSLSNTPAVPSLRKSQQFPSILFPQILIRQFPFLPSIPSNSHHKTELPRMMQRHCFRELACVVLEEAWENDW